MGSTGGKKEGKGGRHSVFPFLPVRYSGEWGKVAGNAREDGPMGGGGGLRRQQRVAGRSQTSRSGRSTMRKMFFLLLRRETRRKARVKVEARRRISEGLVSTPLSWAGVGRLLCQPACIACCLGSKCAGRVGGWVVKSFKRRPVDWGEGGREKRWEAGRQGRGTALRCVSCV